MVDKKKKKEKSKKKKKKSVAGRQAAIFCVPSPLVTEQETHDKLASTRVTSLALGPSQPALPGETSPHAALVSCHKPAQAAIRVQIVVVLLIPHA
jgi:hypothetical protein